MIKNKICLLIPYYNKMPCYFSLWLNSISENSFIDFYMITDIEIKQNHFPANFHVYHLPFKEIKKRATSFLGFRCKLKTAYKLCDYRPIFFGIFPEIVCKYEWWGHCDFDQIFGDLSIIKKLTLPEFHYDKLFDSGHLTLYKNTKEVNERYRIIHNFPVYTYLEVFKTNVSCDFDEALGMNGLYILKKWPKYSDVKSIGDLIPDRVNFETYYSLKPQIYSFENGKTFGYYLIDGNIIKHEVLYVHLQKRKMDESLHVDFSKFLIVPNKFINYQEVTSDLILKYFKGNASTYTKHPKTIIQKIKAHILQRNLISSIKVKIEIHFLNKKVYKRLGKHKTPIDYLSILSPDYFNLIEAEKHN